MTTYIGVSHQYKVESVGGTIMTAYVQNLGARRGAPTGRDRHGLVEARSTRSRSRRRKA